jgi:hypothetical protein
MGTTATLVDRPIDLLIILLKRQTHDTLIATE